ncbi:MAG: nitrite reductase small subunit NirD [Azovibrio sp.]|uniref:nitrite reductase small subunit NirD n=1 Tax=Azovibrio sp. TaxID=1872673 RepID=UPI003C75EF91
MTSQDHWNIVCRTADILPNTGVCALLDDRHIAIFRLGSDDYHALDNIDPRSGASVLSRGLVGNLGTRIVVASPLYKNHFDLNTGECLETPTHSVRVYPVKIEDDKVLVAIS